MIIYIYIHRNNQIQVIKVTLSIHTLFYKVVSHMISLIQNIIKNKEPNYKKEWKTRMKS
jgi:hypothetical protein